jgi:hypothetical protein
MRIAYGRVAGGAGPWEIQLSTLPWLEGTRLFAGDGVRFDPAAQALLRGGGQTWRIEDASLPAEALAGLSAPD